MASSVVLGEASESDSDDLDASSSLPAIAETSNNNKLSPKNSEPCDLLVQHLKCKNELFYASIDHLITSPYEKLTRDINSVSQGLIDSQNLVQKASGSLRRAKRDIDQFNQKCAISLIRIPTEKELRNGK